MLQFSDIIVSATSAPHQIVTLDMFPHNKKMLVLDLAFPRDIDQRIAGLPNVVLYNIESIEKAILGNVQKRKNEIIVAEQIIEQEVQFFLDKQTRNSLYVLKTI
jgi:glutamyl-tRNA reductase